MEYFNQFNHNFNENEGRVFKKKWNDAKALRRLGKMGGLALLGIHIMQLFVSVVFSIIGISNPALREFVNAMTYIVCIVLPFAFVCSAMRPEEKESALSFSRPYSYGTMLLAVMGGLMLCQLSQTVSSWLVFAVESGGVTLEQPASSVPQTWLEFAMNIVTVAIAPALVEEFALRGVIMQPLRRYGDRFAILISALLFGVMHGNLIQAPFAFLVGLAIGYLVIITGSIWTGVLIHFGNNLLSVIFSTLSSWYSSETVNDIYVAYIFTVYILGGICLVFFFYTKGEQKLSRPKTMLGPLERTEAYLFNLPMVAALAYLAYITSGYIS